MVVLSCRGSPWRAPRRVHDGVSSARARAATPSTPREVASVSEATRGPTRTPLPSIQRSRGARVLSPRVVPNSEASHAASILPRLALLQKLSHDVAVEAVRVYGAALADRHLPHGLEFRATRSARARSRGRSSSIRLSARGSCSSPCRRCAYKRLVTTDRRRSMLAALLKAIYEMATPSTDEICDVTALKARFRSISRSSNPTKIRRARTARRSRPGAT